LRFGDARHPFFLGNRHYISDHRPQVLDEIGNILPLLNSFDFVAVSERERRHQCRTGETGGSA
jgi:hypothetical protein